MDKCIYFKNCDEELKFNGEEHVIPAGLGGILKLPRGYVSDKANNKFSKYELKAMRHSLLTNNRKKHGPGKRGNQNVKKEKNIKIKLLKEESSRNNKFLLGYIFAGKSYIIPQITCDLDFTNDKLKVNYIADNFDVENYEQYLSDFRKKVNEFLFDKNRSFTFIKDDFLETENSINIGLYKKKWYIFTNTKLLNINLIANRIIAYLFENIFSNSKISKKGSLNDFGNIEFRYRENIDITDNSFVFIFVKTAFNAMAYLKGQDFVLLNIFDVLRKDIVECSDMKPYIIPKNIHNEIFDKHIGVLPENAHCIYIISEGSNIYAYVTFYNEWKAYMILTEKYSGENFVVGFVCDWKHKKEYTIK